MNGPSKFLLIGGLFWAAAATLYAGRHIDAHVYAIIAGYYVSWVLQWCEAMAELKQGLPTARLL